MGLLSVVPVAAATPVDPSALRTFTAPLRYVQGPGALDCVGELVAVGHRVAAVLVDELLAGELGPRLLARLAEHGVEAELTRSSGEVTQARIRTLAEQLRPQGATVVVAVGGGKTLDTGKGIARELGLRIVTVPTIASNDGPTSRVIALYDSRHRLVDTPRMDQNPEAVVVDTALVSRAPSRFLLAGIGDAIAKKFEAAACRTGTGSTSNGTRPLELAGVIAGGCYTTLLENGAGALASAERGEVSPSLERVVEAVVLMSGLGFENGGLSLAHSMTRGLMALPGAQDHLHGFQVAYGLLVQLTHEGDEAALATMQAYFAAVGLPRSLADLDADASPPAIEDLAAAALAAPHMANCLPTPTQGSLRHAIARVEHQAAAAPAPA